MTETLFSLSEDIRRCTSCPLWKSRTLAVPGEGPKNSKIMVIGEAPGNEEDRQGLPFIGRSEKFLDEMFSLAGIKRDRIFITTSVKCHPDKNRNPVSKELKTCKNLWLDKQISIIKPELIVIIGKIALKSLLNENNLKDLKGKLIERNKQRYFITYHPAAGMRFPKIKEEIVKDFKQLKKLI
jgi:uracil-DNA glycosylase